MPRGPSEPRSSKIFARYYHGSQNANERMNQFTVIKIFVGHVSVAGLAVQICAIGDRCEECVIHNEATYHGDRQRVSVYCKQGPLDANQVIISKSDLLVCEIEVYGKQSGRLITFRICSDC